MATSPRASIGVAIVCGLLGLLFVFAGATKLAGMPMHVSHFAHWGYPQWFRVVVGVWEVAGGLLLLVPATSIFASVLMAVDMAGAVYTTAVRVNEPNTAIVPAVLLLLLLAVAYSRRAIASRARAEAPAG